jgi:ribosomal protein S18 acetylase RimI-like enzyme
VVEIQKANSRFKIQTVCLKPEYQGRGVGSYFVKEVMGAAEANKHGVELSVLKTNPRAKRFYERLGFVQFRESQYHHHLQWDSGRVT